MQIVIDIDNKVYGLLKYFEEALGLNDKKDGNDDVKTALMRAVINGTPLPKGHGRLIDADVLIKGIEEYLIECPEYREDDKQNQMVEWICTDVDDAEVIIEADKESE